MIKSFNYILIVLIVLSIGSCKISKLSHKPHTETFTPFKHEVLLSNSEKQQVFDDLFFDAEKADLVEDNPEKAIHKFQQCLEYEKNNAAVMFRLGQLLEKQKRFTESCEYLEKAVHLDRYNRWHLVELSQVYALQKNFNKAIECYNQLIKNDPDDIDLYLNQANLFIMSNQPNDAIKTLNKIESIIGISPEISILKEKIYINYNKSENAIEELNKLIKAYPKNTDFILSLIDIYVANGKEKQAFDLYKKILEIDSNDGRAQLIIADNLLHINKTDEALPMIYKVMRNPGLEVEPKLTFLLLNYVQKGLTDYNKKMIFELTDTLLETHKGNSKVYSFRADVYFDLKEMDNALLNYKKALEKDKSADLLWKKIIFIEFDKKNFSEAINYCKQAIEYFNSDPELYFYCGIALNQLKIYNEAVEKLETGLKYVVLNKNLEQQYYANLGEVYNNLKDYESSDKYFEKALNLDSNDATALNNYAYYLSLRKSRLDYAERMSVKSLKLEPENPAFLDTYGWILYLEGKYKLAEEFVLKALEKKPKDADVIEHYGDILYKEGNTEEAVEQWKKAKSNGSASDNIDKKIHDQKLYE